MADIFFNRRMTAHTFLWDASFIEPFKNLSNRSLNSFCLLKGHEMNAWLSSDFIFCGCQIACRHTCGDKVTHFIWKCTLSRYWFAESFTSKQSLCSYSPNNPIFPPSCFPLGKTIILHKNKPLGGILFIISRSDKFSAVDVECCRSVIFSASSQLSNVFFSSF